MRRVVGRRLRSWRSPGTGSGLWGEVAKRQAMGVLVARGDVEDAVGVDVRWPLAISTTTTRSASRATGASRTSAAPTASSRARTTRTSTRTPAPRTGSSRSPRRTRSCVTPRSAGATTSSGPTGGPARDVSGAPGIDPRGFGDGVRVEYGGGEDFSDLFEG